MREKNIKYSKENLRKNIANRCFLYINRYSMLLES